MNEQQLQQLFTIQQAVAAAATVAVINRIFTPQQAAALASANALVDPSNEIHQQQQQSQSNPQESRHSPTGSSSPANLADPSAIIQDLLLQLQQNQHKQTSTTLPLNLNLAADQTIPGANIVNPIRSPSSLFSNSQESISANSSNINQPVHSLTSPHQHLHHQQAIPNKKLKRHHHSNQHLHLQNAFQPRNQEATSKSQHSASKSHHSNLPSLNNSRNSSTASASSPSSSTFMPNNVGLPRKLVRGQDVWLGRGAEQTRQILKCMWCGQSFRTLTELTQHMKITQHYTNIISQEQIVSWRQPESSENSSKQTGAPKQSSQNLDDNQDDFSDKFNDSDREESSFSNDEDSNQQPHQKMRNQRLSSSQTQSSLNKSTDAVDNDSNHSDSSRSKKTASPSSKPMTRSKKPSSIENAPLKRDSSGREISPASSSSSHRQNSNIGSNQVSVESSDEPEVNKDSKSNVEAGEEPLSLIEGATDDDANQPERSTKKEDESADVEDAKKKDQQDADDYKPDLERIEKKGHDDSESKEVDQEDDHDQSRKAFVEKKEIPDDKNGGDNVDEEQANESAESPANSSTSATQRRSGGSDPLDPLLALETMVEKSFDPRLRPGVANGGILQRLGIDEEVCPPWQHINYANWYAAAAYGHPMAAALLAAGINLQNGIKLSKNATPKKNDD